MILTTTTSPPQITESFSSTLLSHPAKLCDDSETLMQIFKKIQGKYRKKAKNIPERELKCQQLEKEFLELYEEIIQKEKEIKEGKRKSICLQPFYFIRHSDRKRQELFKRLNYRR